MNAPKVARFISALLWGVLALVFGGGMAFAGIRALPTPGGILTLLLGVAIVACAYALHRATVLGIQALGRSRQ